MIDKLEKSAEVILGNKSLDEIRETSVTEGLNVNLSEIELGVISALRMVFQ